MRLCQLLTREETLTILACILFIRNPHCPVCLYPRYWRRSLRHSMAPQVLHPRNRQYTPPYCLLRRFWCNPHCCPNPSQTIPWRAPAARISLLHLHVRHCYLLPKQHQHSGRGERHRGLPIPRDRYSSGNERLLLPTGAISASSRGLTFVFPLHAPPIHWRLYGIVVPQLVPLQGFRRRYLLLLRWHGLRRRRNPRPFLQDPALTLHPPNLQLRLLSSPTIPPCPVSAPSITPLQPPDRLDGVLSDRMAISSKANSCNGLESAA